MNPDFSIPAGDDQTINCTVTGFTSIAGFTITFSGKKGTNVNTPVLFTKTAIIDSDTAGKFHFDLTSTDTNQPEDIYNYDIKVVDASGSVQHTQRSLFEITSPITA